MNKLLLGLGVAMLSASVFAQDAQGKSAPPEPGEAWTITDVGIDLIPVPAGSFRMGSYSGEYDEKPVHEVRISRPYWLGKHEVTQAHWQVIMGNNPSRFNGNNLPVHRVSWYDCVNFCEKLTERERVAGRLPQGYVYRLPTEAEWEYAARGGDKSQGYEYSGSNNLDEVGWYYKNSGRRGALFLRGKKMHPVGQKKPNELGLYDMSGNVSELCHDRYGEYYPVPVVDPDSRTRTGISRVTRGSSWSGGGGRTTSRDDVFSSRSSDSIGFRVCLGPEL